ncbi:MAG: M15 family metallopeptidase [Chloroflexi bacterium]|nr:M15 family metallopeptidase [Chloroflexota bacterium]
MVNADVANSILTVFHGLFDAHFPIRRMQLVEEFGANDEASMQADNTSGFNCRGIPGASSWSEHAYGRAIDVNPLENPEIRNGHIDPPTAARFADRSLNAQGMIHQGDVAVLETQPKSLAGLADM